ncbi:MAG: CBS domain-containing protein [Chloroflexi bacterium]|nr:MAG: CBS domain-containing protein [Chloroflexota bacterium]
MLTAGDLMTVNPDAISPETSLREIIGLMKEEGYRHLPVVDEQGKVIGIVTDRDVRLVMNSPVILHDRQQDELLLDKVTAESIMTPNPVTITPDTPAYRAAEMLSIYKFGALPVVDNDVLVGILTVTDFLDHFASGQSKNVIEQQSMGQ